jgi:hypothetical protein
VSWQVDRTGNQIWLQPPGSDEWWVLGVEEAWDLGDDLMVHATRYWKEQGGDGMPPSWPRSVTQDPDEGGGDGTRAAGTD